METALQTIAVAGLLVSGFRVLKTKTSPARVMIALALALLALAFIYFVDLSGASFLDAMSRGQKLLLMFAFGMLGIVTARITFGPRTTRHWLVAVGVIACLVSALHFFTL